MGKTELIYDEMKCNVAIYGEAYLFLTFVHNEPKQFVSRV